MAKFELGEIVITVDVAHYAEEINFDKIEMMSWLVRHQHGDWGEMDEKYKKANDNALLNDQRVVSSYLIGNEIVWIVTEADRSITAFMFPRQYSEEKNLNIETN